MSATTTMGPTTAAPRTAGSPAARLARIRVDGESTPALRESRRLFARLFSRFLWLNVPVIAAIATVSGQATLYGAFLFGLAVAFALVGQILHTRSDRPYARYAISACGIAMTALVIAAAAGTRYQIDAHFYVFAMLATLVGWADWRNIIFAVVLVVFHHALLNSVYSWCVFPDGSSILRVALHALAVAFEGSVLVMLARHITGQFAATAAAERTASERAEIAARELDDTRQEDAQVGAMMGSLIRSFRSEVAETSGAMTSDVERMTKTAHELFAAASADNVVLDEVKGSAAEVLAAMDEAARACHSLDVSAGEIRQLTANTASRVEDVERQAVQSSEAIARLSDGVTQLNEIVATISDVAAKTNLLALNATIEAARAGEAGRGFAVVASEVKGLAEQTARATEVIGERIDQITSETAASVDEIRRIGQLAEAVRNDTRAIEQGIDQQSAATHSLEQTFEAARDCANRSTAQVSRLAASMANTLKTAEVVEHASDRILGVTQMLYQMIASFLSNVASSRSSR